MRRYSINEGFQAIYFPDTKFFHELLSFSNTGMGAKVARVLQQTEEIENKLGYKRRGSRFFGFLRSIGSPAEALNLKNVWVSVAYLFGLGRLPMSTEGHQSNENSAMPKSWRPIAIWPRWRLGRSRSFTVVVPDARHDSSIDFWGVRDMPWKMDRLCEAQNGCGCMQYRHTKGGLKAQ